MTIENWQEQLRRGTLELAVLLAIAPGRRYGLEILRHLEFTAVVLTEGTIYPLLARLERDGLLSAEWVEGGSPRARKYYRLTGHGRARLRQMTSEFRAVTARIERLIEAAGGPMMQLSDTGESRVRGYLYVLERSMRASPSLFSVDS